MQNALRANHLVVVQNGGLGLMSPLCPPSSVSEICPKEVKMQEIDVFAGFQITMTFLFSEQDTEA